MDRKTQRITAIDIRKYHPEFIKNCPSDIEYAKVANQVLEILEKTAVSLHANVNIRDLAVRFALYLEDVISEGTTWQAFTYLCKKLFNQKLPFYTEEYALEYYDGEVNYDDVCFLLWDTIQQATLGKTLLNPLNLGLSRLAMEIYNCLDANFEKLPINPHLSIMLEPCFDDEYKQFLHYRALLVWIFQHNYLFTRANVEDVIKEKRKTINAYTISEAKKDEALMDYASQMEAVFTEVCGPLSLLPQQWLAAMLMTSGQLKEARKADGIQYKAIDLYQLKGTDKEYIYLKNCEDESFAVAKTSLVSLKGTNNSEGAITSLAKYTQDAWFINGSAQLLSKCPPMQEWRKLRLKQKYGMSIEDAKTRLLPKETYIKAFGGKRHKFAASHRDLIKLIASKEMFKANDQYDEMILKLNASEPVFAYVCDDGQLFISQYLAEIIPARDNPYRIKTQEAREELFYAVVGDKIDAEVIQYIIDKGWAKTLAMNSLLGKVEGKKLFQKNINFFNRFLHPSTYFARHTRVVF